MAIDERPGTVHWVDHFGVPANDLDRWLGQRIRWVPRRPGTHAPTRADRVAAFRNLGTAHILGSHEDEIPPHGGLEGAPAMASTSSPKISSTCVATPPQGSPHRCDPHLGRGRSGYGDLL